MAVSVLVRPYGYIQDGAQIAIQAIENDTGRIIVSVNAHGLSSNEVIYIHTTVENYNGWKVVDVVNSSQFYLKEIDGSYVQFISAPDPLVVDLYYYRSKGRTVHSHRWSCVHLPII